MLLDQLPQEMYLSPDRTTLKIQNLCKESCSQGQNRPMVIQCNASNIHGYAFANGYLNILCKLVFSICCKIYHVLELDMGTNLYYCKLKLNQFLCLNSCYGSFKINH